MKISLPDEDFFCETLIDLLEYRSNSSPDKVIFHFIKDSDIDHPRSITYKELADKAKSIAVELKKNGLNIGDRALLIYPPGFDLIQAFFGCLYAGVIAVPIYPAFQDKLVKKAQLIVNDANPKIILTSSEFSKYFNRIRLLKHVQKSTLVKKIISRFHAKSVELTEWDIDLLHWVVTDKIKIDSGKSWKKDENILSDNLAFLQYTSGSTSEPKGVMVSHGNLLNNLYIFDSVAKLSTNDSGCSWLPPYHDMGLIGGILQPLFNNFLDILISPLDFLKNPLIWLKIISKYKSTITVGPNFGFDYCVRNITSEQKKDIDLSSLKLLFNGAEPIHETTLERFYQNFKSIGKELDRT
jgi:acyl-CoA synthetase (AMP-forming)/AMP-acid ligase II